MTAGEYVGEVVGGAKVGQMDYDWAFDVPHFFPVGGSWTQYRAGYWFASEPLPTYQSLNGAWGAWNNSVGVPNAVDWSSYCYKAGSYTEIYNITGWAWNGIDDGLQQGSAGGTFSQFTTLEEKLEAWNIVLDKIDETVAWISGNVREGGLGILAYGQGLYYFFATYGLYTNSIGHEKIASTIPNWQCHASDLENGCVGVFCRNRTIMGTELCWIHGRQYNTCTIIEDPSAEGIDLTWWGRSASFLDCLDSSRSSFGDGLVYNTLVSMNSISSPYSGIMQFYWPEWKITDEGYALEYGGPENIILEQEEAGGDAGDNNGEGDYDNSSDEIPLTTEDQFEIDAQSTGFVTVYKPDKATLQNFANWLYGTLPTDFSSWLDNISKLQKNPMDAIISLNMAHYDAPTNGNQDIMFYGKSSGYSAGVVTKLTKILDCGYLTNSTSSVHEYSGNFLDYGGQSNIKIFLPYCGTFSLSTNEVMGAQLHLQYVIDLLSGACVAELEVTRSRSHVYADPSIKAQIYRFTGNIFLQIPISAVDYSNIMRGELSLAAGAATMITGAATSNPMSVLNGSSQIMNTAMTMSPTVERVGSCGSSYGYMSYQIPFIIQEYPWYNYPNNYRNFYGKPIYNYGRLSTYEGYTEIDPGTLWTDKFDFITSEEEEMLRQICDSGGIYIDNSSEYNYDPEA